MVKTHLLPMDEDHHPYLGYQYEEGPVGHVGVEQEQNVDSFYDYDAENEHGEDHCCV